MNAIESIKEAYDLETCTEIVTHGCQSGVCFKHIYYVDTIEFFDKYEDEIMDYFTDNYDADFLVNLFKDADASLTHYKNSVTWAYIEAISFDVVSDIKEPELTAYGAVA